MARSMAASPKEKTQIQLIKEEMAKLYELKPGLAHRAIWHGPSQTRCNLETTWSNLLF